MIGIWSTDDPSVASGCIAFNWSKDGFIAEEVHISSLNDRIKRMPYKAIRPNSGSINMLIETMDKDNALMTSHYYYYNTHTNNSGGGGGLMIQRYPSEVEESAAAVALGSSFGSITSTGGGGTPLLGSSPQGSFKDSFLKFMSNNVQPRSKQRRSTPHSRSRPKFHLKRIELPRRAMMPTKNSTSTNGNSGVHPLAGLFVADCPDGSVQLMNLQYTFSSYPAQVEGKRVDRFLPGESCMVVNLTYLMKEAGPWNVPTWPGGGEGGCSAMMERMQDYKERLQEILLQSDLSSLVFPNEGEGTNKRSTTAICDGPCASVYFSENDVQRHDPFLGFLYFLGEDKTDPNTKLVIIGPLNPDAYECIFFRRVCIDEIISNDGGGCTSSRTK
jgi:hypothetical protein